MKPSKACFDLIKKFEGLSLKAYLCPAKVWTIGYGHTKGVKAGDTITQAQADKMLADEVSAFAFSVFPLIKVPVNQNQFDALVSFAYNVGTGALGKSTLLRRLNEKQYSVAADEFLKWNKAGGVVLKGLVRRREAERLLFLSRPQ
jgi:lysozyme